MHQVKIILLQSEPDEPTPGPLRFKLKFHYSSESKNITVAIAFVVSLNNTYREELIINMYANSYRLVSQYMHTQLNS